MSKQEISNLYDSLKHADKCAVTAAALDYLSMQGINVARNTLHYWRNTEHSRSPLNGMYLDSFRYAFKITQAEPAAQTA